jgi:deoxyguanosine kinase
LVIPHPQMHIRSFVLSGLCELDGSFIHPVLKEPINELITRLNGMDFVRNPNRPQLVSIAGVVGVGKTTLARNLADALDCEILLEPYDTNPYLADVYSGRKDLALDSQLYFLTTRSEQLSVERLPPGQIVISDYIFDQDPIYAGRWLDSQQLALYEDIYPGLAAKVSSPVLVIYMHDATEKCLQRIRTRNRPYERFIGPHFLEMLSCDYERLFSSWKACPVICLSISEFDCMRDGDIEHLANQIRHYVAG